MNCGVDVGAFLDHSLPYLVKEKPLYLFIYHMYVYSRLCVFMSEDSLLFFLSTAWDRGVKLR